MRHVSIGTASLTFVAIWSELAALWVSQGCVTTRHMEFIVKIQFSPLRVSVPQSGGEDMVQEMGGGRREEGRGRQQEWGRRRKGLRGAGVRGGGQYGGEGQGTGGQPAASGFFPGGCHVNVNQSIIQ